MARLSEHGIRLSSMSPSFLNSNSTSHTWPFSAVAELIDNASDPGVSARQVWVDVADEGDHLCLTFTDNGSGMTPNKLHKMLSFGFTEKGPGKASQQAIGVYGNGFKSGSMRLGSDALIFTKNGGCQTVGMLSQTYLANIKAQAVIVPIVPFSQQTKSLVITEDSEASLSAILTHSIITSQEQIHAHFDSILSKKGTKILIWNLRRAKDGKPEIDFDTDVSDFRLPEIQNEELKKGLKSGGSLRATHSIPDMHYSLRAYLSILYLKPRTQIILRGKKILATLVSKRLTHIEHDVYKPHFSKEKVKVTFGLNLKNKDHYGIMMYHRNRLIKAYEKVGCQLKASGQRAGVGVIGIIDCNFLKPAHNKQDFEYTKEYRLTLGALGLKLNDYWREVIEKKAREREFQALERDENADWHAVDEGPMWLQCEECLKWRNVPVNHYKVAPENWNCSLNPNPHYRSCSSPEEAEDSKELSTPSYQKNHKKPDHPKSRKRESSLEVCEFQDQAAKHQILSRSSSEPSRPTFHSEPDDIRPADQCCTEDDQLEQDQTNTDHLATHDADTHLPDDAHTQQKNAGRATVINDKTQNTNNSRCGDEHSVINMELEGREEEQTNKRRHKRISGSVFYCVKSLQEEPESENGAEKMNPEKQSSTKWISVEKSKQDGSSQVEKPGNATLRTTTTALVSPVSRTEGPRSIPLPPEGVEQEANMQRLAALEKEVERLRRLLGLGKMTTGGTMTAVDEKPKRGPASREVGCQTVMAESSTSSSSPTLAPEHQVLLCHRAVSGPTGQRELNMSKKDKTETQSRMRVSGSEACVDSRSSQENLQSIRNNVVVLLTALLPQLDLTGISLETSDVDTILQQILEVNSLKL